MKSRLARQLDAARRRRGLSKTSLARRMATSRAAVDRLLDPDNGSLTLATVVRAARALGRSVRIELR